MRTPKEFDRQPVSQSERFFGHMNTLIYTILIVFFGPVILFMGFVGLLTIVGLIGRVLH